MPTSATDLIITYQFLKRLTTPFKDTAAFKLGIIDDKGKKLKDPKGQKEEEAYGYFDKLVFNLKKLIEKAPGGSSRIATYAAALFLIRESANLKSEYSEEDLGAGMYEALETLNMSKMGNKKTLREMMEDAPANSTGAAVSGTGDDQSVGLDARRKHLKAFLRKYHEGKRKREALKARHSYMRQIGLKH